MTDDTSKPNHKPTHEDPWVAEGRSRYSMQDLEDMILDEKQALQTRILALCELERRLRQREDPS